MPAIASATIIIAQNSLILVFTLFLFSISLKERLYRTPLRYYIWVNCKFIENQRNVYVKSKLIM